jgi:molybdate transport system substrate-binding protein
MKRAATFSASGLFTLLAILLNIMSAHAGVVHVAVAANFTDATRLLATEFQKSTGHALKISYGSTGKLYAQIEHGAPYDIFMAADTERPAKAIRKGLAVPGSEFVYARGKLVLWSAKADLFTNGEAFLRSGSFKRLAIANPRTAPYGLAAQQVMQNLGIWEGLQGKAVRGDSIAQAFQFVATENADIGLVAYSQVRGWKGDPGSAWTIPGELYQPIDQAAVLLKRAEDNPAAQAFIDFMQADEAHKIIKSFGYGIK